MKEKFGAKKLLFLVVGILLICIGITLAIIASIEIFINDDHGSHENNENEYLLDDDYTLLISKGKDFSVYAKEESDPYFGQNIELKLIANGKKMFFKGIYGFHALEKSNYFYTDVTGDDCSDHILALSVYSVSDSERGEELYVFDGNTLKEIPCEDPFTIVSNRVSLKFNKDKSYIVSIDGEETAYDKNSITFPLDTPAIDRYNQFFTIDSEKIICNHYLIADEKHSFSLGTFSTEFIYSDGKLIPDRTCYTEDSHQLFNNYKSCRTGNDKWKMSAYYDENQVTLEKDTAKYTFDLPVYVHDKVYYTHLIKPYTVISENEEFAAIVYIKDREGNNYGCYEEAATSYISVVDLKNNIIRDTIYFEKSDILKSHGITEETIAPYEYYVSGNHSAISIALNVKESSSGKLDIGVMLITDDKNIILSGNASYDYKERKLSNYKAGSSYIGDLRIYTADGTDGLKDLLNVEDFKKECAIAFLEKNTTKLEKLLGCREGVLERYKDFEFEDPKFKVVKGDLAMTVKITKSSLKAVPEGEYDITFTYGRWGIADISGLNTHYDYYDYTSHGTAGDYTAYWIAGMPNFLRVQKYDLSELESIGTSTDETTFYFKNDILIYLNHCMPGKLSSPESYKKAAKDILGIDNFYIPDTLISIDGNVFLQGHGGFTRPYCILSEKETNGIITVRVQAFADFIHTVESNVYEFKYEDHGDYLKLISIEMVEKGEYEPEDRYVC